MANILQNIPGEFGDVAGFISDLLPNDLYVDVLGFPSGEGRFLHVRLNLAYTRYGELGGEEFELFGQIVNEMIQRVLQYDPSSTNRSTRMLIEGVFYNEERDAHVTLYLPPLTVTLSDNLSMVDYVVNQLEGLDPGRFASDGAESGVWRTINVYILVNPLAGGCSTVRSYKLEHVIDPETKLVAYSFYSSHHNCFFACIFHAIAQSVYAKVTDLSNDMRALMGVPKNVHIPLDRIHVVCKSLFFNARVISRNGQLLQNIHVGSDQHVFLMLDAGHYFLVKTKVSKSADKEKEKCCERCGTTYKWTHACSSVCIEFKNATKRMREKEFSLMKTSRRFDGGKRVRKDVACTNVYMEGVYVLDFETFFDPHQHNETQPYAVGTYHASRGYKEFRGPTCAAEVVDDFVRLGQEASKLVTFNGSGFDYFPLVVELLKRDDVTLEVTPQGSKILQFRVVRSDGSELATFDLYLFLMASLAKVCKDFRLEGADKKDIFPHKFVTSWDSLNYVGPLPDASYWKESWADVQQRFPDGQLNLMALSKEYLEKDILATLRAYEKVGSLIQERFNECLSDYITLPHFAFSMWKNTCRYPLYIPSAHVYGYISQSLYAGRCYPRRTGFKSAEYNRIHSLLSMYKEMKENGDISDTEHQDLCAQLYESIEDYSVDLDVVSLYPHAMTFQYPYDKPRWATNADLSFLNRVVDGSCVLSSSHLQQLWDIESNPQSGYHGIFDVEFIPNSYSTEPVLPRRKKTGGLEWTLEPGRGVYTSIDLCLALEAGYGITRVLSGLVYPKVGCIMKDFILQSYEMKAEGERTGNGVLRSMGKLLMNSVYGKFGQRPIYDKFVVCNTVEDVCRFMHEYEWKGIMKLPDTKGVILTGSHTCEVERNKCVTKPTHVGCFILAHSRRIMMKIMKKADPYMNSKDYLKSMIHMPYYGDTDSLHYHARQMSMLQSELGKELGQLTNDLGDGAKIIRSVFVSPKLYCVEYLCRDGKIGCHMRAKGVPSKFVCMSMYDKLHDELIERRMQKNEYNSRLEELEWMCEEGGCGEEEFVKLQNEFKEWCKKEYGVGIEFELWKRSGMKSRVMVRPETGDRDVMLALRIRLCLQTRRLGANVWEGRQIVTPELLAGIHGSELLLQQSNPYYFTLPRGHVFWNEVSYVR